MIVPFLFTLDEYAKNKPTHLWVALKFYDFCYKNSFPIILQDKYAKELNSYDQEKHPAFTDSNKNDFNYSILTEEELSKIDRVLISENETNTLISKYKNIDDAAVKLLNERNNYFESIIDEKIQYLLKKYDKKIDAIITWINYPSLEEVANKYNIPVINYELSTIRPGKYRDFLGYFKIGNKYNNFDTYNDFLNFKFDCKKMLLFNNKELINLFISDDYIDFINIPDNYCQYEVGLALGLKKDYFAKAYDGNTYDNILKKISKFIPDKKISVRSHPAMPFNEEKYNYYFDHSPTSIEWISSCKNIICSVSNIGYEAILFNRGLISTNDKMVTSFGNISSLDYYDPKKYGLLELNFLTFAYYVPYDLLFDVEYIRYRLKEKNIYNIYNFNMNYILKKHGLSISGIKKLNIEDRFNAILNTHNIDDDDKKKVLFYYLESNCVEQLIKKLDLTLDNLDEANNKYNNVINSKGWQFLEKIRRLKNFKNK